MTLKLCVHETVASHLVAYEQGKISDHSQFLITFILQSSSLVVMNRVQKQPHDCHLLLFTSLWDSLPLGMGWNCDLLQNPQNMAKGVVCYVIMHMRLHDIRMQYLSFQFLSLWLALRQQASSLTEKPHTASNDSMPLGAKN